MVIHFHTVGELHSWRVNLDRLRQIPPNSLILKYITVKSLFLKDLDEIPAKSLILKDRQEGRDETTAG